MGEEFYCVLKLVSGEELFSLVSVDENDGETVVILQNPVIIKTINHNGNHLIKIKPWIELSNDDIFVIRFDKIITMTEAKDEKIIEIYNNYVNNDDIEVYKDSGKVEPSSQSGYVSSVEKARKNLENIFNNTKDTKES